jgi:MFS family permease
VYPAYQAARSAVFWMPVFFLYFSESCSVREVFLLEAIYYAAVVLLEVPSGYLSDRLGRRPTLIVAATAVTAAHVVFASTASFGAFAVAQGLLAAGMAFNSGTDSALLFDSLKAEGSPDEFGKTEGRAQAWALVSMAVASAVGGLCAGFELRLAYVLSVAAGVIGLGLAIAFVEPSPGGEAARSPALQLRAVRDCVRIPRLGWVFAFTVAMTVFNHVPYELVQPYLRLLLGTTTVDPLGGADATPVVTGVIAAVGLLISAFASRRSAKWAERIGHGRLWMGLVLLQGATIAVVGLAVHPAVALLFALRGIPGAVMRPTVGATVHPLLDSGLRATYLSVQSLAGRLSFSLALLGTSQLVGELDALDFGGLQRVSRVFAAAAAGVLALLWLRRAALGNGNGSGNGGSCSPSGSAS